MLSAGTRLQDRYEIVRHLASGGMGAVYVANDSRFRNVVAVKESFLHARDDSGDFWREARLLRELKHPSLPVVIDYFEEDGAFFLVMDYVDGDDAGALLAQRMKSGEGPFPVRDVLDWGDQVLRVLEYLHEHVPPIVHRDIKPRNLKVTRGGRIMLLDFGLSKGTVGDMSLRSVEESVSGFTPSYAPIEQMQGTGTTPLSDLYSLGASLYTLMTGQKPTDALTRSLRVTAGGPDPLIPADRADEHVPRLVAETLKQALALDPANRFESAAVMRAALNRSALEGPATDTDNRPISITQRGRTRPAGAPRYAAPEEALLPPTEKNEAIRERGSRTRLFAIVGLASVIGALAVAVAVYLALTRHAAEPAAVPVATSPTAPPGIVVGPIPADAIPPVDLGGGVTLDLVWVPSGSFTMGSLEGDSDEQPLHRVTLSSPIAMGRYEVTQRQWSAVMGSDPSTFKGADQPVEAVSWREAQAFVERLNAKVGGAPFRLPTEAEWEFACRAGSTEEYSGSLSSEGWFDANSGGHPQPVGMREPNSWGLYDMHGNVWEWCQDPYGLYPESAVTDPLNPEPGAYKVLRGGSWIEPAQGCRAANRNLEPPGKRDSAIGFRVVRTR